MNFYTAFACIITLAAFLGYINNRFLKMPTTIAISAGSLLLSLFFIILTRLGYQSFERMATHLLGGLNFKELLLEGMLNFLLFAGALTIRTRYLKQCKWEIGVLAFGATIASTFLVGFSIFYLLESLSIHLPLIFALLFGALISPTDPIAVLAIFKQIDAPKKLDVTVAGESLFNDGVGIVLFITLSQIAFSGQSVEWHSVGKLFLQQSIGGIAYGFGLGYLGYRLLKPVTDLKVAILMTLAIVMGGYALAGVLNISGPLAMVVSGIFIGNHDQLFINAKQIRAELEEFWELIDEVLNAVLFLLIGLEILVIQTDQTPILLAAFIAIPLVLLIRFLTVAICMAGFQWWGRRYDKHFIKILTWGGLRGGLAIALALGLPPNPHQKLILAMTYAVVIFSVIIQGVTIKPLAKHARDAEM